MHSNNYPRIGSSLENCPEHSRRILRERLPKGEKLSRMTPLPPLSLVWVVLWCISFPYLCTFRIRCLQRVRQYLHRQPLWNIKVVLEAGKICEILCVRLTCRRGATLHGTSNEFFKVMALFRTRTLSINSVGNLRNGWYFRPILL